MKRVGLVLLAVVGVTLVSASLNIDVTPERVLVSSNSARGATPSPTPDPLTKDNEFVCVAVPVFSSQKSDRCPSGLYEIPNDQDGGAIIFYLKLILKLVNFSIGGILILFMIVAGIQYITSVGDPAKIKAAKARVVNVTIALVLYMMMFAILNFLIPGGVLS